MQKRIMPLFILTLLFLASLNSLAAEGNIEIKVFTTPDKSEKCPSLPTTDGKHETNCHGTSIVFEPQNVCKDNEYFFHNGNGNAEIKCIEEERSQAIEVPQALSKSSANATGCYPKDFESGKCKQVCHTERKFIPGGIPPYKTERKCHPYRTNK